MAFGTRKRLLSPDGRIRRPPPNIPIYVAEQQTSHSLHIIVLFHVFDTERSDLYIKASETIFERHQISNNNITAGPKKKNVDCITTKVYWIVVDVTADMETVVHSTGQGEYLGRADVTCPRRVKPIRSLRLLSFLFFF